MGTGVVAERTSAAHADAGRQSADAPEVSPETFENARATDGQVSAAGARLESALSRLEDALREKAQRDLAAEAQRDAKERELEDATAALQRRIDALTTENDQLRRKHELLGERLDATIDRIKRLMQG